MEKPAKIYTPKDREVYLKYYDLITRLYPSYLRKDGSDYDDNISRLIMELPSELRLHYMEGNNQVEIVNYESADSLWDKIKKEIESKPYIATSYWQKLSDKEKGAETGCPDFFSKDEFVRPLTVDKLCEAITADYDTNSIQVPVNTIKWLNKLLEVTNLFDILNTKKPDNVFAKSKEHWKARGSTVSYPEEDYRDKVFSDLNKDDQKKMKKFNRFVLERFYPAECPQTPGYLERYTRHLSELMKKRVKIYLCQEHKKHLEKLTCDLKSKTAGGKAESDYVFNYHEKCLSYEGTSMKLSSKRNVLLIVLKKPRNIRYILKKYFSESVGRDEKLIDNKAVSINKGINCDCPLWDKSCNSSHHETRSFLDSVA